MAAKIAISLLSAAVNELEVYISVGSNQGDSIKIMEQAYDLINERVGEIVLKSSFYETEPWGFDAEQNFINSVIKIKSTTSPEKILEKLLEIERVFGRIRSGKNGYESRPLDLDIVDVKGVVKTTQSLDIPHPRMHERGFVLLPLLEIDPLWKHPVIGKGVKELVSELKDDLSVCKVETN
ncbi:2-amino-4-hydroxy-6-hydroxymethyldihydropteridine diphosphokinase [Paracrocinitomix mangrovi]|uniref:2-amino-4-hydroxy-6- hydroxymethyldihydropteridine diphosphokinase n=1 Tax=Paracrocinitomix mangrovi TaxID=2862509 RepID=UPI001C8D71D0|nr:2-amino-4-hydroxy-6-hydroxymethyldihydropteridine diphosphokinase [Paracrocinitomix mangrovi]UKN03394.1 2-amino-4-hydroxy-6-hydroxymethyldihydropteridine diphosphokinase [Paracrocinitomix mangrovi]